MTKPAVVILEDSSKVGFGGGQQITLHVIDALSHQFKLFVFDTGKSTRFNIKLADYRKIQRLRYYTASPTVGSINILNLMFELVLLPFQVLLNALKILKLCGQIRMAGQKVVVYSTTKKTLFFVYFASLLVPGLKYVHHLHSYENTHTIGFKFKQKLYAKAKALISVSDFIYNCFKFPNNHLINNPVVLNQHATVKDIASQKAIRVVTFSSLIPAKGVEYLMQAHQYLPKEIKEKVFIDVYGDGKQYHALKQFENTHVSLKGYCNNIHTVLNQQAHITVVATVIPESFGLQIVESFSCGVPVIATQIGAQGQLVKHQQNGLLVTIKNPADIAEKIAWMVQNPIQYKQLANQAILDAKLYDIGQFKNSVLHLFEKVLTQ